MFFVRETDVSLVEIITPVYDYKNIVSSFKLPLALNEVAGHTSAMGSQVCPEKSNTKLYYLIKSKQFNKLIQTCYAKLKAKSGRSFVFTCWPTTYLSPICSRLQDLYE